MSEQKTPKKKQKPAAQKKQKKTKRKPLVVLIVRSAFKKLSRATRHAPDNGTIPSAFA